MIDFIKSNAGWVALVILAIMAVVSFTPKSVINFGAAVNCQSVTCFTTVGVLTSFQDDGTAIFNGAFAIGSSGTAINQINTGQCYVVAYATTIAASSTAQVDCQGTALIYNTNTTLATALPGVTAGSNIVVTAATSTGSTNVGGLALERASASTTPGFITLTFANLTGAVFTWPTTGTATGTVSYIATK